LAVPFAVHVIRVQSVTSNFERQGAGQSQRAARYLLLATALAGLFFALDLGFWNTSLLFTSAANATLLGNTSTLWVALGATLFFHERLRRRFWAGMLLAFAGAVVIVGRDAFEHPTLGWGDLLALTSSTFYAAYLLNTERVRRYMDTLTFMWLSSAAASLFLLAYVLATGQQLTGFSANTCLALIALGLISHAGGWLAINYALGHLPASLASVTLLSQPVITALVAVPLLGEGLSLYQVGGGVLVLIGVYIVNRQ
jgi:drug/metabolite transporter (DMT)-like permease